MYDEFSIERRASEIFDTRTKEYFSEVTSSYTQGNYRAATVILWSVTIYDLFFKLQNLKELYSDETAQDILKKVKESQEENKYSSAWEKELIELVSERTQLLDTGVVQDLCYLREQRNLSAHPMINDDFQLYRPNRETVRALIRNVLDGVLVKHPILSTKIISELLKDIEDRAENYTEEQHFKSFLEGKYFKRFNPEVEKHIFRSLWKIVFYISNEECSKNRKNNFFALRILFNRRSDQFISHIRDEPDYFSNIAHNGETVVLLIRFLALNPKIYGHLQDTAKNTIQNIAKVDLPDIADADHFVAKHNLSLEDLLTVKCLSWFVKKDQSLCIHYKDLIGLINWLPQRWPPRQLPRPILTIDKNLWKDIATISDSTEWLSLLNKVRNRYYAKSMSFDTADRRFQEAIEPALSTYTQENCQNFIEQIKKNDQTWNRGRASDDHKKFIDRALEIDPSFDNSQMPGT